jgi:hypothetical protein
MFPHRIACCYAAGFVQCIGSESQSSHIEPDGHHILITKSNRRTVINLAS